MRLLRQHNHSNGEKHFVPPAGVGRHAGVGGGVGGGPPQEVVVEMKLVDDRRWF